MTIADRIAEFSPCADALKWAAGYTSAATAWAECNRGDWLLWIIGRVNGGELESKERKRLVLCSCECARLSLPIFEKRYPQDERPRKCLETAERWANGESTIDELRAARAAAYAAADAAALQCSPNAPTSCAVTIPSRRASIGGKRGPHEPTAIRRRRTNRPARRHR